MGRIRRATKKDVDAIISVQQRAIAGIACGYSSPDLAAWSQSAVRRGDHLANAIESNLVCVGESSGGLGGFAELGSQRDFLVALYVDPSCSHQGLGTELSHAIESLCRDAAGVGELRVCSGLNAVSFYEQRGFVRCGDSTMSLSTGERLACVSLSKTLKSHVE